MTADFHDLTYDLLHQAMDRLIDAASTCEAHGDILSVDPSEGGDLSSDALGLIKAQIQVGGGDEEIPHLQQIIGHLSQLLIIDGARQLVLANGDQEPIPATYSPQAENE